MKLLNDIFRYFEGKLSPEEKEALFSRIGKDDAARRRFIDVKNFIAVRKALTAKRRAEESEKALLKAHCRLGVDSRPERLRQHAAIYATLSAAAAVLVLFFSVITVREIKESRSMEYLATLNTADDEGRVGLVLSSGKKISLNAPEQVIRTDRFSVNALGNAIDIRGKDREGRQKAEASAALNYMNVNTKNDYLLTLEDGTRIWMRSRSRIGFPDNFSKDCRQITFEGEGYFNIAPDASRPFTILSGGIQATVVGTEFNFRSLPEEHHVEIGMSEGKLEVSDRKGLDITISKDTRLTLDTREGTHELAYVDGYRYTAWKDGYFLFSNDRLGDILQALEKWYELEIRLESGKYDRELFFGKFSKNASLDKIIGKLQESYGFHFYMENDTLHIN